MFEPKQYAPDHRVHGNNPARNKLLDPIEDWQSPIQRPNGEIIQQKQRDEPYTVPLSLAQLKSFDYQKHVADAARINEENKLKPNFLDIYQPPPIQKKSEEGHSSIPNFLDTIQKQPADTAQQPIQKKPNNTGLPDNLKNGIENLSGYSMDDVKVHYNSPKPAQLQAHAYAQGTDIHVAMGQEKHLPHEAWHVVQQKQGRVKPTIQMKGDVNVNDDAGLEKEADAMGGKALQFSNELGTSYKSKKYCNSMIIQPVAQCKFEEKKKNNTIATRNVLKGHRQTEGKWNKSGCQKNFAINLDNTNQYAFSDEGGHSERNLLTTMIFSGWKVGTTLNMHTERQPCQSCHELLREQHDNRDSTPEAFDMNISYTVKYPGNGNSKDELYDYYKSKSGMP